MLKKQRIPRCTLATSEGSFGYTGKGTILEPETVPLGAVGRVEYDSEGHGVGAETLSLGGMPLQRTYEVTLGPPNPNCTGSGFFLDSFGRHSTFDYVLVGRATEVFILSTDSGTVLTVHGVRQSNRR